MEKYIESFDTYTSDFDMHDKLVFSRYNHSYRVMELSRHLSQSLKWEQKDVELAMIIGLIHDYGRFEQIRSYNTISDKDSVDHAEYAIKFLFDENRITDFTKDEETYSIIRKSIYYHNKYALPVRGLTRTERRHMKLLRDSNRLDIMYREAILKESNLNIDNCEIKDSIKNSFFESRIVPYIMTSNSIEVVIHLLSLIFDLNYIESFRYLKMIHLLDIFYLNLSSPSFLKPYFDFALNYIEGKCS